MSLEIALQSQYWKYYHCNRMLRIFGFQNDYIPESLYSELLSVLFQWLQCKLILLASNYLLKENIVFEQSLTNAKPKVWTYMWRGLFYISNTVKFDQTLTSQHLAIHLPEGPQKYGLWRLLDCKKWLSTGFNNLFLNMTWENSVVK